MFWSQNFYGPKFWQDLKNSKQNFFIDLNFLDPKFFEAKIFWSKNFWTKTYFWSANLDWNQGLTKLEFDTEDQVLFYFNSQAMGYQYINVNHYPLSAPLLQSSGPLGYSSITFFWCWTVPCTMLLFPSVFLHRVRIYLHISHY